MISSDHDVLRDRLDAFSRRLETRVHEFKERGAFSDAEEASAEGMRKRHAALKQKLDSAISKGATREVVKYEVERDFNSLFDDFALMERRLEAEAMRQDDKS